MSVLVDTNVLLRGIESRHPMHQLADDSLHILRRRGERLLLTPQNIYEFWVASTRPVAHNGLGLTPMEAEAEASRFKSLFAMLPDSAAIFPIWERLVVQHQVIGKNGHDARLIAAMIVHGIDRLLTFNKADFARYQQIVVLSPQDVLSSPSTP